MELIVGANRNPYFNLASEEYLLKHTDGEYFYIWVDSPAVIVGVNQNAFAEVNLDYTRKNGIKVVRRMSGGGAVYHDENNACYTVITKRGGDCSFARFSADIVGFLATLGINSQFSGRNDLLIDGKKFSGAAQAYYKDRVLHHGTLLFDSDFSALERALKVNPDKLKTKGVSSVKSRVTNLNDHFCPKMSFDCFLEKMTEYFSQKYRARVFNDNENQAIEKLVNEKYGGDDWNLGYSPKGEMSVRARYPFGEVEIDFDIISGKLDNTFIRGDFFGGADISELCSALDGTVFERERVAPLLANIDKYIFGATADDILRLLFGGLYGDKQY